MFCSRRNTRSHSANSCALVIWLGCPGFACPPPTAHGRDSGSGTRLVSPRRARDPLRRGVRARGRSGHAAGYTLPTLAADCLPPTIVTVPVVDIEPGLILLAWPSITVDPLVDAFVSSVREALAAFAGGEYVTVRSTSAGCGSSRSVCFPSAAGVLHDGSARRRLRTAQAVSPARSSMN